MAKDYYKTLGVEKGATKDEIKKAYKRLAKKYHPDLNKEEGSADKFKEINEAAAVLSDDQKRQQYDQYGDADAYKQASGFSGFDASGHDFRNFGFDFGDIFDAFFGGGSRRRSRESYGRSGSDLISKITITLEEVVKGTKKTIVIPRLETCEVCKGKGAEKDSDIGTCPTCGGTGAVRRTQRTPFGIFQTQSTCGSCYGEGRSIKNPCAACNGGGRVKNKQKLEIDIPAGVDDGTRLRIRGEGDAGEKSAPSGDLYVIINVEEHDIFERHDNDLYLEVPISFTQAALGDEITVPTIDGKAKVKIPSGTQTGTIFRLKNRGIPNLHSHGSGSELIKVIIKTPKKLSKKEKELLKKLDKEAKENPYKDFFKNTFEK